jgi:hypothetical protein
MPAVNPLDNLAIQNTIARYCEALDTKQWPLLDKVFMPGATADYPFNNDLRGVDDIRNKIQNRYVPYPVSMAIHAFDFQGSSLRIASPTFKAKATTGSQLNFRLPAW